MNDIQAPWVGLCEEDYMALYERKKEVIGECVDCGKAILEEEEHYDEGDMLCSSCYEERKERRFMEEEK